MKGPGCFEKAATDWDCFHLDLKHWIGNLTQTTLVLMALETSRQSQLQQQYTSNASGT